MHYQFKVISFASLIIFLPQCLHLFFVHAVCFSYFSPVCGGWGVPPLPETVYMVRW